MDEFTKNLLIQSPFAGAVLIGGRFAFKYLLAQIRELKEEAKECDRDRIALHEKINEINSKRYKMS